MKKKKTLTFLIITYVLVIIACVLFKLLGGTALSIGGMVMMAAALLTPMVAVLLTQKIFKEPLMLKIGLNLRLSHWFFFGWLMVPVLVVAKLALSSMLPGMGFLRQDLVDSYLDYPELVDGVTAGAVNNVMKYMDMFPMFDATGLLLAMLVGGMLVGGIVGGIFFVASEMGWRGYLLKQFEGQPFIMACLVIGLTFGLWLSPLVPLGLFFPLHHALGIPILMVFCLAVTPILIYVRIKTGSVWLPSVMLGTLSATALVMPLFVVGYNELYTSVEGLAGIGVLVVADMLLMLCDSYITKEHIMTSPLVVMEMPTHKEELEAVMQGRPNQEKL